MMVSGAYYICLQYGSEIFPTVIRGQVSHCMLLPNLCPVEKMSSSLL